MVKTTEMHSAKQVNHQYILERDCISETVREQFETVVLPIIFRTDSVLYAITNPGIQGEIAQDSTRFKPSLIALTIVIVPTCSAGSTFFLKSYLLLISCVQKHRLGQVNQHFKICKHLGP